MKHINIEIDDKAIIERVERQAEATILHELVFTANLLLHVNQAVLLKDARTKLLTE